MKKKELLKWFQSLCDQFFQVHLSWDGFGKNCNKIFDGKEEGLDKRAQQEIKQLIQNMK